MRRTLAALLTLGLAAGAACGGDDDSSDASVLELRPVLETSAAPCDSKDDDAFELKKADGSGSECLQLGKPIVDADDVRSATVGETISKEPSIAIVLGSVGGANLDQHAAANQGKRLAIVAGGKLVSAPVLTFSSFAGRIQVTGLSKDETDAFFAKLNDVIKPD